MKKYGLIGKDIQYSISPKIHQYIFNKFSLEADYELIDVDNLNQIKFEEYAGLNITIPYKKKITNLDFSKDKFVEEFGIANTFYKNKLYNTDKLGFSKFLEDKKILDKIDVIGILGDSSTAKMIQEIIVDKKIILYSRKLNNYQNFQKDGIDLIINTTPIGQGQFRGKSILDKKQLKGVKKILDFNYSPFQTKIMIDGKLQGALCYNGLEILIYQAIYSQVIWNDLDVDIENLKDEIYNFIVNKKVIYGMPLSGKTTLYEKIKTKDMADLDLEISKKIGDISKFIKKHGITKFRNEEYTKLKELVELNIQTIFVGGGCMMEEKNIQLLEQYQFVYLKKNIDELLLQLNDEEIIKRPLINSDKDLKKVYNKRKIIYENIKDIEYS